MGRRDPPHRHPDRPGPARSAGGRRRPSRPVQLPRSTVDRLRRLRLARRPRPRRRVRAEAARRQRAARSDRGAAARAGAGGDPRAAAAPAPRRPPGDGAPGRGRAGARPAGPAVCPGGRGHGRARPPRPRDDGVSLRRHPPDLRQRLRGRRAAPPGHPRRPPHHAHLLRRLVAGRRRGARHLSAGRRIPHRHRPRPPAVPARAAAARRQPGPARGDRHRLHDRPYA